METWKPIDAEGLYEVSDRGVVRSWCPRGRRRKDGSVRRLDTPRILKPWPLPKSGHLVVDIGGTSFYVHRLVLEAFVGPCPPGKECRHLDDNPEHNARSNLAWGTRRENMADRAPRIGWPKVEAIRRWEGTDAACARALGVSQNTVRRWRA